MRASSVRSLLAQASPWTCRSCTQQIRQQGRTSQGRAQFSTKAKAPPRPRGARIIALAAVGTAGAGAFAVTDSARHGYEAVERTGRVVSALALCMNEYVKHALEEGICFTDGRDVQLSSHLGQH